MPPKAQTNVLRGRGRPKRGAAGEAAPARVVNAPEKKRGRVAKIDEVEGPAEPPKKRGRPAKSQQEETVAVIEAPRRGRRSLTAPEAPVEEVKKRRGRPARKEEVIQAPATSPKKRTARSTKAHVVDPNAPTASKPRGRPPKNAAAVDLKRVAGPSRVIKSRSKPAPRVSNKTAPNPRLDPRLRSKLRTRAPPAQKITEDIAPQPAKRRGRPPKNNAAAVQAPSPKKPAGRKTTKATVSKPTAVRKKRGYTTIEISDKFVAQVQQYIQELEDAESLPTPVEDDDEAEPEAVVDEAVVDAETKEGEGEMIVDEEVYVTGATASIEIDGALASDATEVKNLNAGGAEEDLQDDLVRHTVGQDSVDESPEVAADVDLGMSSLGEQVHVEDTEDVHTLVQESDAAMNSLGDEMKVLEHDAELRALAGYIY